jgi:hypothetical protein
MKLFIFIKIARLLLGYLLKNGPEANDVVDFVTHADKLHENEMSRRGYVYQTLKTLTPESIPHHMLNLAVELGVFIHKNGK